MVDEIKDKKNTEESPSDSKKIHVFLIDDDKFLLDMYSLKFQKAQVSVEVAFSSLEALKKLRDGFSPEIIVLDIIMPGMDGLELLSTIRKEKLAETSTVVVLTNQADDSEKAKKFGADGFIVKAMNIPSEVVNQTIEIYNNKKH